VLQANATVAMAALVHHPRDDHQPTHHPDTRHPDTHHHKGQKRARHRDRDRDHYTRHLVATPLDADVVDVPVSLVVASVLQADAYVSATPCSRGAEVTGSPWDDVSGLQQWLIQPAEDGDSFGEYTIAISSGRDECPQRFLGAATRGSGVALYARDDGSGRQRWVFKHVGDATTPTPVYSIRLAGGKKDEYVYLGLDRGIATPPEVAIAYPPPVRMRLYDSSAGPRKRFAVRPVPVVEDHDNDDDDDNEDDRKRESSRLDGGDQARVPGRRSGRRRPAEPAGG